MTRSTSSVVHALRDLTAVMLIGLVSATAVAFWVVGTDSTWQHWIHAGFASAPGSATRMGWDWTRGVAAPLLAVWYASHQRSRLRTQWLPAVVAVALVLAGVAAAVLPWPGDERLTGFWPGPADPFAMSPDGTWALTLNPAWGYPVLTAAAFVCAAALGRRDGARADLVTSRRLTPVPPGGRLLALAVVGLPAIVATTATIATLLVESPWYMADSALFSVTVALTVAALLSGTGVAGIAVTALAAMPIAVQPAQSWLAGGADLLLLQAAASVVACVAVAAWRPCTVWAADAVRAADPPPKTPAATSPV